MTPPVSKLNEEVRRELRKIAPATSASVYLNCAFAGPVIAPVADALEGRANREFLSGRGSVAAWDEYLGWLSDVRGRVSRLLGAEADETGLTHHTTEGINAIIWGLEWEPTDRLVTTTLEHAATLLPLYQLHRRRGVRIDFADIGFGDPDRALDALEAALERAPRLLVVSHVTWCTGATLPIAEIVEVAHRRGIPVLVDGAQAVGAVGLDFAELGADFYAFNGYKWLCGPEGTGALLVKRPWLGRLSPTFTGTFGIDGSVFRANDPESLAPAPGAARYEFGCYYQPAIAGFLAAVDWHLSHGDVARSRIAELAAFCRERAMELRGMEVLTPEGSGSGIICVRRADWNGQACVARLEELGVMIRHIPTNDALRISCGFFNSEEEIADALAWIDEATRAK